MLLSQKRLGVRNRPSTRLPTCPSTLVARQQDRLFTQEVADLQMGVLFPWATLSARWIFKSHQIEAQKEAEELKVKRSIWWALIAKGR